MKIAPFRIEKYFALHEFTAPHLLSSSDAECVPVADILALEPDAADRLFSQQLRYTQSEGAPELRAAASAIYKTTASQDIVVVSAAEEGIFAAYHALLQPGDHVVVETPCYESALQLARSTGANLAKDHVHPTAMVLEHITDAAMRERLAKAGGASAASSQPLADPHGRSVPPKTDG